MDGTGKDNQIGSWIIGDLEEIMWGKGLILLNFKAYWIGILGYSREGGN